MSGVTDADLCLTDVLARRGMLAPAEVVTLVVPLALDLAALHAGGESYGAAGPDAVGFGPDGRPMLRTGRPASSYVVAPEVARGAPVGAAADVFALAGIGYWALSGRPPWDADDADAAWVRAAAAVRPPLAEVAPAAPARLVEALEAGLAEHPRDRCEAGELAERILASGPAAPLRLPRRDHRCEKSTLEHAETTSSLRRVAIVVLVAVLVVAFVTVRAHCSSAAGRWSPVLGRIDRARSAAVTKRDPSALRGVYADGAAPLARDIAMVRALVARGLVLRGRLAELADPLPLTVSARDAVLAATERPASYVLVDRRGRVVLRVHGQSRRLVVRLRRVGRTWLVTGVTG